MDSVAGRRQWALSTEDVGPQRRRGDLRINILPSRSGDLRDNWVSAIRSTSALRPMRRPQESAWAATPTSSLEAELKLDLENLS